MALAQIFWGIVVLAVAKLTWELFFSRLSAFPGPIAARITDVWRAIATARGHVDDVHRKWHKKYGTAVRIGPNTVSISDPDLIRTIYATRNPWQKSDMYRPNDALIHGHRLSNIFNTQDNAWHDRYTNPIRPFWTMSKVLSVEPLMNETLSLFTDKLGTKFASASDGKVCMMDDWLNYFAWDTTANITFGRHYGFLDQEHDVDNLINDSTKGLCYFAPVSQIPWIDHLLDKNPLIRIGPKPTLTGVLYAFQVVAQYQQELKEKDRAPATVEHYLDKYIRLKEVYPDMVDDNQLVNWLMLNILAGGDTTSSTMHAIVYYLAKNPANYKKLVDELDAARLTLPAQWDKIANLTYLDAVVREGMRINPGIAMIFERVVPQEGFNLPDGRNIPGGTKCGINPGVTNRDRDVFGADADHYNADRWLQKEGESDEQYDVRLRRMRDVCEFTFGGGNRVCLGKSFARLELFKLFATLYSLYDIKLVDPNHKWKYHNAWFVYQWDIPMTISRRVRG